MKIAVIGSRGIPASFGGIERHVEELYSRLSAMGHDITVYCRAAYVEQLKDRVEWEKPMRRGCYRGCKIIVSPTPSTKGIEAFAHSLHATMLAMRQPFDLFHYHAIGPTLLSGLPMARGRKVVATCHGLDWQRGKWGRSSRRFLQYCERFMGQKVPNLICVSEDLRDHFEETYRRKVLYIPNGAEAPQEMQPQDFPELGLQSGKYICFFGRLAQEKEIHTLIRAFQLTRLDLKLAIVGGSAQTDEYVESLKKLADERVVFTGYAYGQTLQRLIANSRFVVNPSRMEGLPIVVLEAYGLGKHVLASDIPPHRQVVGNEEWLFPAGDVRLLAKSLELLVLHDLPHREEALVERIRTDYDWDRIARRTEEYFLSIVE